MTPPPTMRELSAVRIPLRDSIELVADCFVGDGAAPAPAILELTPYGRGRERQNFSGEAAYWVRHGYAFVIVDCRGTGDSRGDYRFAVGDGGDGDDGYDVVEWIARQPWCNGRVGMRGASYTGTNQWQVARKRPPSLKAIVPNATGHGRDDVVYDGGIFHFNWALSWPMNVPGSGVSLTALPRWAAGICQQPLREADVAVLGQPSHLYRHFIDHPPSDQAYWAASHYSGDDYAGMQVPVLAFSGWFDGTLRGTLAHDQGARAASRHPVHLIVGPWDHSPCSEGGYNYLDGKPVDQIGDALLPPQAFLPGLAITRSFYDAYLKGDGKFDQPPVQLYITGSERWIHADAWPPAASLLRKLHLRSAGHANGLRGDGRLDWAAPHAEPPDTYVYDPAQPAFNTLSDLPGAPPFLPYHRVDMAPLIDRPDVLVYVSDALAEPLTVVGDVTLLLHIRSDAPDTDFIARLEDVAPDGRAQRLGSREIAQAQVRWREGFEREVFLRPGEVATLNLRFGGIGHSFLAGHRLRLSVTSSAYPRMAPNPNTGGPIADDTQPPRIARQEVLHEAAWASHLVLPCLTLPA
jgi:uncharacterized protein